MGNGLSVALISSSVGKTPKDITYSFVFDEAYRLVQRGVKVHVVRLKIERESVYHGIHFHGIEKKYDTQVINLLARNITCYPPISLVRRPTTLYRENLYALNVAKVVDKNDIDLIHAHFAYPEGLVGLLCQTKLKTKIPLILTSHGYDLNVIEEYKYGIRLKCRYNQIIRKVCKTVDHIIVPSKLLFLRAIEAGAHPSKISLIPNAVDLEVFNPRKIDGNSFREKYKLGNSKIVLTIRALKKHYGIDRVIRIARKIPDNLNIKFVIIGKGELYADLLRTAGNMLGRKIMFLGTIPHSEIPYAIAAADIVFDPCPIGQGISILESMAMERPVIGIRTKLWDYIINEYTGFLVTNDDEIVEKIIYLIENPSEAKRMGIKGRRLVEEKFNINKRIEAILSLYKKLLSKRCS
jgi:glycosyltransferase involved in cell wall biosynthesis